MGQERILDFDCSHGAANKAGFCRRKSLTPRTGGVSIDPSE
uniref:Uncharacterized protein n=1 Tax=Arundo donax TaxID=35708 RepID=A0A0A9BM19_ARUDO